ncbi:MAG: recombination protein RecR [Chloroflexi bacterium]|jgi:recombination protein RecR|nr:recombination protein RecR [Chloroflexota bacterium]
MSATPRAVTRLVEAFSRLPGIGPKTASRLTYFLLRGNQQEALMLAEALQALHAQTQLCSVCCNISESDPCDVCADDRRDGGIICVVEEPLDVLAIENTAAFRGRYHVLHGHLSPMERVGPDELRMRELVTRVEAGGVDEVIVATNPTLEGDATAVYLTRLLSPLKVQVTRLALGLPRGGDVEYADRMTLSEAIAGRREISI